MGFLKGTTDAGCEPTARVVIGDTEVPWVGDSEGNGGIETHMVKTGPADLTRFTDLHIPYEWGDDDVLGAVTTAEYLPEPTDTRTFGNAPIRVDIKDHGQRSSPASQSDTSDMDDVTGEYVTVHHGPIANSGSSSVDGCFRLRVADWANYFESVNADREFANATVGTVVEYVLQQLAEHSNLPEFSASAPSLDDDVYGSKVVVADGTAAAEVDQLADDPEANAVVTTLQYLPRQPQIRRFASFVNTTVFPLFRQTVATSKSFESHKHDLTDVLDWVAERTQTRWYVEPSGNTPTIVFEEEPNRKHLTGVSLDSDASEDDVRLLENNALFQISPQHTLGVRGKKSSELFDSTTTKPEVVVEHEILTRIAGRNPHPNFMEVDTANLDETVNVAKSRLKKRIDGAAGGQMIATPAPRARPYATIEAQPSCSGRLMESYPSLTYEVEEVIHELTPPTPANVDGPRTKMRCGVRCTFDDLNVVRKRELEL